MTENDDLELRLQEYGARWRASVTETRPMTYPPAVGRVPGRRRNYPWIAAAAVVAITLGGTVWATGLLGGEQATPTDPLATPVPWNALDPTRPRFNADAGDRYAAIDIAGNLNLTARPGQGTVLFTVTLTSPKDLPLDPCPDFTITERFSYDDEVNAPYGLNCAAVPFRDEDGVPYLPAGTPVAFAMELTTPDVDVPTLTWSLEVPGSPGALTGRLIVGEELAPVEGADYCAVLEFDGRPYEIAPEQPGTGVGRLFGTAQGSSCGDRPSADVQVYAANEQPAEEALTVSYPDGVLVYVPRYTSSLVPVPYPDIVHGATDDVRGTDLALVRRFTQFAVRPIDEYADAVPFDASSVRIGLGSDLASVPSNTLAFEGAWSVDSDGFAGSSGPINLLVPLRQHLLGVLDLTQGHGDLVATVGDHDRCVGPPATVPADLAGLRHVAIQPAPTSFDSCLEWFAIDLFLSPDDRVVAVSLDLWEP